MRRGCDYLPHNQWISNCCHQGHCSWRVNVRWLCLNVGWGREKLFFVACWKAEHPSYNPPYNLPGNELHHPCSSASDSRMSFLSTVGDGGLYWRRSRSGFRSLSSASVACFIRSFHLSGVLFHGHVSQIWSVPRPRDEVTCWSTYWHSMIPKCPSLLANYEYFTKYRWLFNVAISYRSQNDHRITAYPVG